MAAGRPPGPDGKALGRPPGMPGGPAAMGGPGGPGASPLPSIGARAAIGRSLPMLRAVRGPVTVSIVLGLLVAGLPFVVSATFATIPILLGKAAGPGCGGLQKVWELSGALYSHAQPGTSAPQPNAPSAAACGGPAVAPHGSSGLMHWLATPLPFAVLLTIWAAAAVMKEMLGFVQSWIDARVSWKLLTAIRQRVHDHLESLSLDFFTGAQAGALMQRVQMEPIGVQQLLQECLIAPSINVVVLVLALAYMVKLSWGMTIVMLILSPFALSALVYAGKNLQAITRRSVMNNRLLGGELEETINGMADIQVFDAEQRRSELFHEANSSAAKTTTMMLVWIKLGSQTANIFVALSTVLVLVVGIAFSSAFGLTATGLTQFVLFVPTMFAPAQQIVQAYTKYKSVAPQVAATYQLLDMKPSVQERPGAREMGRVRGDVTYEDVVFGYAPDQKVLNGFTVSIDEGETVALVGPIGSGKSTVFNLLLRFLDPERGRILLDGQEISAATLNSLREQVSKLSQFPFFLKDTIRENVRLGRQDATDAEVEEACKQAHIHSVIVDPAKMADGYDTVVDVQVPSGGQKRLIALARCLLRKPEVLLLDEPTENLDADQRVLITRVIREYASDRTCIVISHDMDFVKAVADRIIVLHDGRVAEDGTHDELMSRGGIYKELHDAQNVDPALVRGAAPPLGRRAAPIG
jgi:ATP-binding cassette subfamily B protein